MGNGRHNLFDDPFIANRVVSATTAFRDPNKVILKASSSPSPTYIIKNSEPSMVLLPYDTYCELVKAARANEPALTFVPAGKSKHRKK